MDTVNDNKIEELSRLAVKGDSEALKELMNVGEEAFSNLDYEKSAIAFKESAISYRIDAFRKDGASDRYRSLLDMAKLYIGVYEKLLGNITEQNLGAVKFALPIEHRGQIQEYACNIFTRDYQELYIYLEHKLMSKGMEFYSPGGSIQRRVSYMLEEYFNFSTNNKYASYFEDLTIKYAFDCLAKRIIDDTSE